MNQKLSFRKGYRGETIFRIFNSLFLLLLIASMLVPILKVVSDSLDRSTTYGINLWPAKPSFLAYKIIFSKETLYRPFLISCYVMVVGTFVGLTITTLGAFVLNKKDLIGRGFLSTIVFITMVFNGGLIPTFLVLKSLGLINTLWAVILPLSVNAFNMILMRNFFEQLPISLFESAEMDGASPMRVFVSIVLPLSKAGLAAIGLFFAVFFWNEFFSFIMYISERDLMNFQMKVREMILNEQNLMDPGIVGYDVMLKNASIIVTMLPFLFMYSVAQKYFITGVTLGSVKE